MPLELTHLANCPFIMSRIVTHLTWSEIRLLIQTNHRWLKIICGLACVRIAGTTNNNAIGILNEMCAEKLVLRSWPRFARFELQLLRKSDGGNRLTAAQRSMISEIDVKNQTQYWHVHFPAWTRQKTTSFELTVDDQTDFEIEFETQSDLVMNSKRPIIELATLVSLRVLTLHNITVDIEILSSALVSLAPTLRKLTMDRIIICSDKRSPKLKLKLGGITKLALRANDHGSQTAIVYNNDYNNDTVDGFRLQSNVLKEVSFESSGGHYYHNPSPFMFREIMTVQKISFIAFDEPIHISNVAIVNTADLFTQNTTPITDVAIEVDNAGIRYEREVVRKNNHITHVSLLRSRVHISLFMSSFPNLRQITGDLKSNVNLDDIWTDVYNVNPLLNLRKFDAVMHSEIKNKTLVAFITHTIPRAHSIRIIARKGYESRAVELMDHLALIQMITTRVFSNFDIMFNPPGAEKTYQRYEKAMQRIPRESFVRLTIGKRQFVST